MYASWQDARQDAGWLSQKAGEALSAAERVGVEVRGSGRLDDSV
jgi:hypothetical protein